MAFRQCGHTRKSTPITMHEPKMHQLQAFTPAGAEEEQEFLQLPTNNILHPSRHFQTELKLLKQLEHISNATRPCYRVQFTCYPIAFLFDDKNLWRGKRNTREESACSIAAVSIYCTFPYHPNLLAFIKASLLRMCCGGHELTCGGLPR